MDPVAFARLAELAGRQWPRLQVKEVVVLEPLRDIVESTMVPEREQWLYGRLLEAANRAHGRNVMAQGMAAPEVFHTGHVMTSYEVGAGQRYTATSRHLSVQRMQRVVRRAVLPPDLLDVDLVNAQPTVALAVATMAGVLPQGLSRLRQYVTERERVLRVVGRELALSRSQVKALYIRAMHQAAGALPHELLREFHDECMVSLRALIHRWPECPPSWQGVYMVVERAFNAHMVRALGEPVRGLVFDGFLVERHVASRIQPCLDEFNRAYNLDLRVTVEPLHQPNDWEADAFLSLAREEAAARRHAVPAWPVPRSVQTGRYVSLPQPSRDGGRDTIVVEAAMGGGKSYATQAFVSRLQASDSILVVTPRVSLAVSFMDRYGAGFSLYADRDARNDHRFICEYESLHHKVTRTYDVVILDELTSICCSVASDTNGRNTVANYRRFVSVVTSARVVVATCADLTLLNAAPELVLQLRANTRFAVVTHQPAAPPAVECEGYPIRAWRLLCHPSRGSLLTRLSDDCHPHNLEGGERVYVVCRSISRAEKLAAHYRDKLGEESILLYTSRTAHDVRRRDLGCVNDAWGAPDIRMVIITSTVTVGISYTGDAPFSAAYVDWAPSGPAPREVMQMLGRVRHLTTGEVHVVGDPNSVCRRDGMARREAGVLAALKAAQGGDLGPIAVQEVVDDAGMFLVVPSPFGHCHAASQAESALRSSSHLLMLARRVGWPVEAAESYFDEEEKHDDVDSHGFEAQVRFFLTGDPEDVGPAVEAARIACSRRLASQDDTDLTAVASVFMHFDRRVLREYDWTPHEVRHLGSQLPCFHYCTILRGDASDASLATRRLAEGRFKDTVPHPTRLVEAWADAVGRDVELTAAFPLPVPEGPAQQRVEAALECQPYRRPAALARRMVQLLLGKQRAAAATLVRRAVGPKQLMVPASPPAVRRTDAADQPARRLPSCDVASWLPAFRLDAAIH